MAHLPNTTRFNQPPPLTYKHNKDSAGQPHHNNLNSYHNSPKPTAMLPPPTPPEDSREKQEGEDGWSFWARVYETPELRAEAQAAMFEGPTVSEVISHERRRRSQMVLDNVPLETSGSCEQSIRSLVQSVTKQSAVSSVRIHRMQRRAFVYFYRAEDASEAVDNLHGHVYKHHRLIARVNGCAVPPHPPKLDVCSSDVSSSPSQGCNPLKVLQTHINHNIQNSLQTTEPDRVPQLQPPQTTPTSQTEPVVSLAVVPKVLLHSSLLCVDLVLFAKLVVVLGACALYQLVQQHSGVVSLSSELLAELVDDHHSVRVLYVQWPLGLVRLIHAHFPDHFTLDHNAIYSKQYPGTESECNSVLCDVSWEPCSPQEVQTAEHLAVYVHALISRFGRATGGGVVVLMLDDWLMQVTCVCLHIASVDMLCSHVLQADTTLTEHLLCDTNNRLMFALPHLHRDQQ